MTNAATKAKRLGVTLFASLVRIAALAYIGLTLLLFFTQARYIYQTDVGRDITTTPRDANLAYEEVWLDATPGVKLHGWFLPHPTARGTVLFFHGNAGSIARLDWLRLFHDLGYATFIIDYRGFGRSTGKPDEQGTYTDASTAWRYLTTTRGIAAHDVVIVGESLGGAVATELATRVSPRALVLQSTFTSIPDLAAGIYPWLPVRWISRFDYDTGSRITQVAAPVLVAHSPDDDLIPFRHGKTLYARANQPKRFIELAGGHDEGFLFARPEWTLALDEFLRDAERH